MLPALLKRTVPLEPSPRGLLLLPPSLRIRETVKSGEVKHYQVNSPTHGHTWPFRRASYPKQSLNPLVRHPKCKFLFSFCTFPSSHMYRYVKGPIPYRKGLYCTEGNAVAWATSKGGRERKFMEITPHKGSDGDRGRVQFVLSDGGIAGKNSLLRTYEREVYSQAYNRLIGGTEKSIASSSRPDDRFCPGTYCAGRWHGMRCTRQCLHSGKKGTHDKYIGSCKVGLDLQGVDGPCGHCPPPNIVAFGEFSLVTVATRFRRERREKRGHHHFPMSHTA